MTTNAASEWYPADVVAAIRAVHTHAIYDVLGTAPLQEAHAMCNLYQAVFRQLINEILHEIPAMLFTVYCFVNRIKARLVNAVSARRHIAVDVPPVCMRFQVEKGCTFHRCPHVHQLQTLPTEVLQWVTPHHVSPLFGHASDARDISTLSLALANPSASHIVVSDTIAKTRAEGAWPPPGASPTTYGTPSVYGIPLDKDAAPSVTPVATHARSLTSDVFQAATAPVGVQSPGGRPATSLTPDGFRSVTVPQDLLHSGPLVSEAPGAPAVRSLTSDAFSSDSAPLELDASDTLALTRDAPGAPFPVKPSASDATLASVDTSPRFRYIVAAFDRGCRLRVGRSAYAWSVVFQELNTFSHLVRRRFAPSCPGGVVPSGGPGGPAPDRINTRAMASAVETPDLQVYEVAGILRCVPADVIHALRDTAKRFDIPFPVRSAFLHAGSPPFSVPGTDADILDALISIPQLGIVGTLRLFRGQTSADPRPSKALRPWLYRMHLATYPQLELLCAIATEGIIPPWTSLSTRCGVRPLPDNYRGAESGEVVVTTKLLADYNRGRCLVAYLATLEANPGLHSSSFAMVPKKDIPLTIDGRIIHDLSAPPGDSVNDLTNSAESPDATWDPFGFIAQRVRNLRSRYTGYIIYAMISDIADAFHHVPVHADHAPAFEGRVSRSNHGIVSGIAVFGWTSSLGFFAVLGKAVRHYQRTGQSTVLGYSERFWAFQWVDDIVLIEVDIDDRLQKAEQRLRDGWDIPNELVTVPQRKIAKMRGVLENTARWKFVTMKQLDSLVGVLRHIITFIPV
ncbi:hypothetical protein PHMEG_00015312 [Phytophthora megakarya]|uniref:Reverse transcriptase n=1 Tax=Phytophthora megakarya TaxID=4795 RepID=A0A225W375_9STRA|nr:hypothetical protein PHMEG_00015312 [Phytophthora megakarya]